MAVEAGTERAGRDPRPMTLTTAQISPLTASPNTMLTEIAPISEVCDGVDKTVMDVLMRPATQ